MSECPTRHWLLYIDDMLRFAMRVRSYTSGCTHASFVDDSLVYDATLRNLELIGEAAGKIPAEIRAAWPDIPWRQISAVRNRLIHGYLGIDNDTIWSIVDADIPALIAQLQQIKSKQTGG